MKKELYIRPDLILTDLSIEGFVCTSYPFVQVDEFDQEEGGMLDAG